MYKTASIILILLLAISCTERNHNNISLKLYSHILTADSLINAGNKDQAKKLLDIVIKTPIPYNKPNTISYIKNLVLESDDQQYYDYLFASLAQLDAIEMCYYIENNSQEKINILQSVFSLFPYLDKVIEEKPEYIKPTNSNYYEIKQYYDKYISITNPNKQFHEYSYQLTKYIYQRKWSIINSLLIESDKKYGYEHTYKFFDSIFVYHGSSSEEYTKALAKAYMSFSKNPKYEYTSGMNYDDFKSIADCQGEWIVTTVSNHYNLIGESEKKEFINVQNAGFIIQINNDYLYNPSILKISTLGLESQRIRTINSHQINDIHMEKGVNYKMVNDDLISIDKSLLCALLYKHKLTELVPYIKKTKQYRIKDTLIREGYENNLKKIIYYNKNNTVVKWQLFDKNGLPACDSTGIHLYINKAYERPGIFSLYIQDSSFQYHYDHNLKLKCFEKNYPDSSMYHISYSYYPNHYIEKKSQKNENYKETKVIYYSNDGSSYCDDDGTHVQIHRYYEDSTINYYYNKDLEPRKKGYARKVITYNPVNIYYYDWSSRLFKKEEDGKCTLYEINDSKYVITEIFYDPFKTVVTTTFNNDSPLLTSKYDKEVKIYDGIYSETRNTQYGNLMAIHRIYKNGKYYNGTDEYAFEMFKYDNEKRLAEHSTYNEKNEIQLLKKYFYSKNSIEIKYYDKGQHYTKSEIIYK